MVGQVFQKNPGIGRSLDQLGLRLAFMEAILAPPKYGTFATNPPPLALTSLALEMRPVPRRAANRPGFELVDEPFDGSPSPAGAPAPPSLPGESR